MGNIAISSNKKNMYTSISNDFIDKYISEDGIKLKVYIYLLSLTQRNVTISSMESIAVDLGIDTLAFEKSLLFWQTEGLISLSLDNNQNITGIIINDINNSFVKNTITNAKKVSDNDSNKVVCQNNPNPEREERYNDIKNTAMKSLMPEQGSIKEVVFYAEKYLQIQIDEKNKEKIVSIYNHLYGNVNLVEHLLMYAAEHNKKSLRYLEKIAIDWNNNQIKNIESADNYLKSFNDYYGRVANAYGLSGRNFSEKELEYINKWYDMFHTNSNLIIEACGRTMLETSKPSMEYTNAILEKWRKENVSTMEDVERLDAKHKASQKSKYAVNSKSKNVKSSFNYENQRDNIDFDKLEEELINPKKYESNN